jgi:hypothetical protein
MKSKSLIYILILSVLAGLSCSPRQNEQDAAYAELLGEKLAERAPQEAEKARLKAERDARFVWGKTVGGLRAAVELIPEKGFYTLGDRVGVRIHIQNVSSDYVQIYSLRKRQDVVIARNARGRLVDVVAVETGTAGPSYRGSTWPGSTKVFESCGLGFGDSDDPPLGDSEESGESWNGNILRCGPGEYSISYRLGLSETVCSLDGRQCITYPGDWRGTLVPGVRKVKVVAPEASESGGRVVRQEEADQGEDVPTLAVQRD